MTSSPCKSCYIFGAAPLGSIPLPPDGDGGMIIAADAGLNAVRELGLAPHIVLGDFDSLGEIPQVSCKLIRHPVEKDDTDTALAVKLGLSEGCDRFYIFGGMGGERPDHMIANLQLLTSLALRRIPAFLTDGSTAITAVSGGSALVFSANYRGDLSVFAADGIATGVCLKNLKYTAENAELTPDFPLGVSNSFLEGTAEKAVISVQTGTLWVFFSCKCKPLCQYPRLF